MICGLYYYTLIIFTLAIYGISWMTVQSQITAPIRSLCANLADRFEYTRVLGSVFSSLAYLVHCMVCTSVWVTLILLSLSEHSAMLSLTFPPIDILDYVLWAGYGAATTWILSLKLGDAD